MTELDSEARSLLAETLAKRMLEVLELKSHSCLNCEYFNEPQEYCEKADGQRPPARVIAYGCPLYLMKIPF